MAIPQDAQLPVIVLAGPTASGKTAVAIALAERLGAEIVSADSRQIYKDMPVGTAQPSTTELGRAKHHFIGFLPLDREYSAGQFSRDARACIQDLRTRGKSVIVAGGSGMYLTALLDGFFEPAVADKALQRRLKTRAAEEGSDVLHRELQDVDPERADALHPNDAHRIVRALEVFHATGKRLSELRRQPRVPAPFPFRIFGLQWPRAELYRRIEQRVEQMMASGFLEEVRALRRFPKVQDRNALQTVGYRELMLHLDGKLEYDDAVETIKQATRNFAKRQITWFGKDERIQWLPASGQDLAEVPDRLLNLTAERSSA